MPRKADSIYTKVQEPPGHALGMAQAPGPSIALACSCGYEDTWWPNERMEVVARRFNRHLR